MNLSSTIFQKASPDLTKLTVYGFKGHSTYFNYIESILDDDFYVTVRIDENAEVTAKVIDAIDDSEYENVNLFTQQGEFVNSVRDAYRGVLERIREHCFIERPFVGDQANRIAQIIHKDIGDAPEDFMGKKAQAFKTQNNQKWYGIVINIHRDKVTPTENKDLHVEVLNIKVNRDQITEFLKLKGYYPAYHMNKKHWVSIILDETLPDSEVMGWVLNSHSLVSKGYEKSVKPRGKDGRKSWIVPANPKYYDVITAFKRKEVITWKQGASIALGDTVFLYLGAPYSAILYQCLVVKADMPYTREDSKAKNIKLMHIKRIAVYDKTLFPFSLLKQYGVNAVRSARGIPEELIQAINNG